MPRITIQVIAPNTAYDGEILSYELPPTLSLADLKGFVNAETNLPQDSQQFWLNNHPIQGNEKTLEELGIKDDDMLAMLMRQPEQENNMGSRRRQQNAQARSQGGQNPVLTPEYIEAQRQGLLNSPESMAQLRQQVPALVEVVNDRNRFKDVWMEMIRTDEARYQEGLEQMRQLNDDPFDVEKQKEIEEMIRKNTVNENLEFAYEHNPEVFARVTMLYIPVEVNKHPVKAFVDSGAQTTIMSPSCAEACGITHLIDKRYAGVAKGVGTAKILGRVHSADIKIGSAFLHCSFTVMEGKDVDLLLGLDMLKRFQAVIDLNGNKLILGGMNEAIAEISFLGEADIPKYLEEAMENEPTISGPNGTEIGAQTGTVKPAGTSAAASSSNTNGPFRGQGQTLGTSTNSKAPVTNAPAQASTSAASGSAATQHNHPKEKIDQLVSIGFTESQAIGALDACDGNVDIAAGLLFGL